MGFQKDVSQGEGATSVRSALVVPGKHKDGVLLFLELFLLFLMTISLQYCLFGENH